VPSYTFCRPRCARGVTLIEIMIVIAIMMILMGLVMTVIGTVRKRAKENATRLLLDGVASSMSRYHMEYDDYPIDTMNPLKSDGTVTINRTTADASGTDFADDGNLFKQMNGDDGLGSKKNWDTPYQKRLEPFLKLQPENLRKEGTSKLVVYDFFSRPIRYCNAEIIIRTKVAEAGDDEAAKEAARKDIMKKVHNDKVDLWSLGDNPNKAEDDIQNWQ